MFEFIRLHFGPYRIAFLFHYLLARAEANLIKRLLPIVEKTFDYPWVARVELNIRSSPGKATPNRMRRLPISPRNNDVMYWDAPVTVSIFRKRRGKERQALCMSFYIRFGVLYIVQLQGVAGTDVPPELRPWASMFVDACKKFACQQGLREVRVAKAGTLHSYRSPHGRPETLTEDLKQTVPRIRRDMELLYDSNALEAGLMPDGNWFKWQNATSIQGYQSLWRHATRIAASVGLLAATTAILSHMHDSTTTPQRLVFYYLPPLILITVFCSGRAAIFCAGIAILCADYFLQDPVFSFYTSEWGDLIWFAVLAAFAIKTTEHLLPPGNRSALSSL